MSAAEILEKAQAEGVLLALLGDRLTWEADHQPPTELLEEIRSHRLEIIEVLSAANDTPPHAWEWLARVADLLGCAPDFLLKRGFVDCHDLAEQHQQHPRLAAQLILSHPDWHQPGEVRAQHSHASERQEQPTESPSTYSGSTAAATAPAWIAARDAFHAHALGHCSHCYPPLERYCVTGTALRARYLKALP